MMNDMEKTPDLIVQQAAEHFATRHSSTLSERRKLEAWLKEDARHAAAYSDLERLWDRMDELADDAELRALKASDLAAIRQKSWRSFRPVFGLAASVLLLLGSVAVWKTISHQSEKASYVTAVGERRTELMSDGTEIVLNTDSVVEVVYTEGERSVDLKQGEAQFTVAHDAARPFVVAVGESSVRALGTRFQVRRGLESTAVTLLEGSVEVTRSDEKYVLRPNEQAVISNRVGVSIASISADSAKAWLDGWLNFRGVALAEVIAEANRYSVSKLRLGDPRLASVKLNGNFRAGDNNSIAEAASALLDVRLERTGTEIVLLPSQSSDGL